MSIKIGFWGSSSVTGAGDEQNGGFVGYFANWTKTLPFSVEVYNHGVVAQNSTQTRDQFLSEFSLIPVEYAVFYMGTNDAFRLKSKNHSCNIPLTELAESLRLIHETIKKTNSQLVLLTPYPRDDSKNPTHPNPPLQPGYILNADIFERVRLITDYCIQNNIKLIDLWNENQDWALMLEEEGLHVNGFGHQIIAEKIIQFFKKEFVRFQES